MTNEIGSKSLQEISELLYHYKYIDDREKWLKS